MYPCNMSTEAQYSKIRANLLDQIAHLTKEAATSDKFGTIAAIDLPAATDRLQVVQAALWRSSGISWREIGEAFGTSHQAAQQRFASKINDLDLDIAAGVDHG